MSTSAAELAERKSKINILLVEDEPIDAKEFKEQLARVEQLTGRIDFEVEHLSSLMGNIKQAAEKADIVVLDIYVKGSAKRSFRIAKELIEERPHRAVIFLTAHLDAARSKLSATHVPFTLEKNEVVMGSLPNLMVKIFALQKSRFLLNSVRGMSQQHDQSYLKQELKTAALELRNLNFCMGLMDRYISARRIIEPSGYRRLHQALSPMFAPNYYDRPTFSKLDLISIVEPNLRFAEGTFAVLKQIEGVITNPYLEKELDLLREFDPTVIDNVQYEAEAEARGEETAIEEAREQPTDVVRKYTEVNFPKMCVLLEKVCLKIQFKTESPGHGVNVPFEGSEEVDVLVYLSGDGFEITENSKTISVPRQSESEVAEFVVQPRKLGDQYLFINFYKGTMRIGCIVVCTFVGKEESGNE